MEEEDFGLKRALISLLSLRCFLLRGNWEQTESESPYTHRAGDTEWSQLGVLLVFSGLGHCTSSFSFPMHIRHFSVLSPSGFSYVESTCIITRPCSGMDVCV